MGYFSHRKRTPETNFEPIIKHFKIIFLDQASPNRKIISPPKRLKNANPKIGFWFRFQIPKTDFGCTLSQNL